LGIDKWIVTMEDGEWVVILNPEWEKEKKNDTN